MKGSLILVGALIVLVIIGAVWFLSFSLDSIVKDAIENYGSRATGTQVRVSSVDLSLSEGRGIVRGIRVGNPDGFSSQDAISFAEATLDIDVASLTQEPIVIDEIRVESSHVRFELHPTKRSNIDVIRRNIEAYGGGSSGGRGRAPSRFLIRKFTFQGGEIEVDLDVIGEEALTLEMPTVRLNDVGGQNGATAGQIGKILLGAFGAEVSKIVARKGLAKYIDEKLGGEAADKAKELLRTIIR